MITKWKSDVCQEIDRDADRLKGVCLFLHDHPEVAWQENRGAQFLSEQLVDLGFVVERPVAGLATAFRATRDSGKSGPHVAFIAEFDALPGVGHGCGHNLIAGAALGAAGGVAAVLHEVGGKITVMGTPAEEYSDLPQAKIPMLAAGAFDSIDACLMIHPWTSFAPINSSLAFCALDVSFHGKPAHASSDPWNGRNALDGVVLTFNHINALRQHLRPDVRIHGIVRDGGVVPNIIPIHASARFMIRARYLERAQDVLERVEGCIEGAAMATGTEHEIQLLTQVADTAALTTLQALTRANFEILGIPFGSPIDWTASTDFGDVSYRIPSESFFVSLGAGPMPWHSREVAQAASEELALNNTIIGAKVLAMDAIDLLAQPAWIAQSRRELPAAK